MATKIIPLPVKTFTKENPCTKVDIHNTFATATGYARSPVVTARGIMGINAVKYLKREGLVVEVTDGAVDYWQLTPDGEAWLKKGLERHLELHPEEAARVKFPVTKAKASPRRRRLTYSIANGIRVTR